MASKFKYLWKAIFEHDGEHHIITQPRDDKYSKHNPEAEWNPSSFRDFQEYFDEHPDQLVEFRLETGDSCDYEEWGVCFDDGRVHVQHGWKDESGLWHMSIIHKEESRLYNLRPIYYRQCESEIVNGEMRGSRVLNYTIGYQGNLETGENVKYELPVA